MRRFIHLAFLAMLLAGCSNSAPRAATQTPAAQTIPATGQTPGPAATSQAGMDKVVATVDYPDGTRDSITQAEFDQLRLGLLKDFAPAYVLDRTIARRMLYHEGQRLGIALDSAELDEAMQVMKVQTCEQLSLRAQLSPELQQLITDPAMVMEACARHYGFAGAEALRTYMGEEQVIGKALRQLLTSEETEIRAAQIVLLLQTRRDVDAEGHRLEAERRKPEIDAIYERIKADPAQFAPLADEKTEDYRGKGTGGELAGYFGTGFMQSPEFDEVAFSLKPGEISQPFLTNYGWHIIKVLDARPLLSSERLETYQRDLVAEARQAGRIKVLIELPPAPATPTSTP